MAMGNGMDLMAMLQALLRGTPEQRMLGLQLAMAMGLISPGGEGAQNGFGPAPGPGQSPSVSNPGMANPGVAVGGFSNASVPGASPTPSATPSAQAPSGLAKGLQDIQNMDLNLKDIDVQVAASIAAAVMEGLMSPAEAAAAMSTGGLTGLQNKDFVTTADIQSRSQVAGTLSQAAKSDQLSKERRDYTKDIEDMAGVSFGKQPNPEDLNAPPNPMDVQATQAYASRPVVDLTQPVDQMSPAAQQAFQDQVSKDIAEAPSSGLPSVSEKGMNFSEAEGKGGGSGQGQGQSGSAGQGMGGTGESTGHSEGDPDSAGGGVGGATGGGGTGGGAFAKGTRAAPPGWAWVGEKGPELVRMVGGEPVVPANRAPKVAAKLGMGTPGAGSGFEEGTPGAGQEVVVDWDVPAAQPSARPAAPTPQSILNTIQNSGDTGIDLAKVRQMRAQAVPVAATATPAPAAPAEVVVDWDVPTPQPAAPAAPAQPTSPNAGFAASPIGRAAAKGQSRTMAELYGRDPRVDYKAGTDQDDAVALAQASNPAEERKYLAQKYGAGNVFQDKGGTFYVMLPSGRLVAPGATSTFKGVLATGQAESPVLAGAAMGGVMGGPPGAVAGGLAGYAANEIYKMSRGRQEKTPTEQFMTPAKEAAGLMLGEGVGKAITAAPGTVLNAWRRKIAGQGQTAETAPIVGERGVTAKIPEKDQRPVISPDGQTQTTEMAKLVGQPETERRAVDALERGGVPPMASVAPEAKRLSYFQDLTRRVLGPSDAEKRNAEIIQEDVRRLLTQAGKGPEEIEAMMARATDKDAAPSVLPATENVGARVGQITQGMENEITRLTKGAQEELDRQLNRIRYIGKQYPAGDVTEETGASLAQARKDIGRAHQKIYAKAEELTIDPATGEPARLIPSDIPQQMAREILEKMGPQIEGNPALAQSAVVRQLQQIMKMEPMLTLSEAQYARSFMREAASDPTLTPGMAQRQLRQAATSFDAAMRQAAKEGLERSVADDLVTGRSTAPNFAAAKRILDAADKSYSTNIRKFEDETINRIVANARSGLPIEADKLAGMVLDPDNMARVRFVKSAAGPDLWKRIVAADWDSVMQSSMDKVTKEVDLGRLAAAIKGRERNGLLQEAYGPGKARELQSWIERMGAFERKIPVDRLTLDKFGQTMSDLVKSEAKLNNFMAENALAKLAKPGPEKTEAIRFLITPGQGEAQLRQAMKTLGENSPEMQSIRDAALERLLYKIMVRGETGVGNQVAGDALLREMGSYTSLQQRILFPGGLGEDLRELGKQIKFLFPKSEADMAAGLAAGEIKSPKYPFFAKYLPTVTILGGVSKVLQSPRLVGALASGFREGGTAYEAAKQILDQTIMASAREGGISGVQMREGGASDRLSRMVTGRTGPKKTRLTPVAGEEAQSATAP